MSRIDKKNKTASLRAVNEATADFFRSNGGRLLFSRQIETPTYDHYHKRVRCLNYYIEFNNNNLFGSGSFSDEVYPRYRAMRADWKAYLRDSGVNLEKNIAVGFVPVLSKASHKGDAYRREDRKPFGSKIVRITKKSPKYYFEMSKKFGVKFSLKETGGMFVGPENGMMIALKAAADSLGSVGHFLDIGAGTGELSAYIIKGYHPEEVMVNDISPILGGHFHDYLKKIRNSELNKIVVNIGDCQRLNIPRKIDLASLGVFYGSQPDFFKKRGKMISRSLGASGALIVQSSMPETLFNQHLLMGDCGGVKRWPWYSERFNIINSFFQARSFFIDNQFLIIASNSASSLKSVIKNLPKYIVSYSEYKSRLKKVS
jgi:SAM-dependent methyltransferase